MNSSLFRTYFELFLRRCCFRDEDLREDEIDQIVDASPEFIYKQREEGDGHEEPEGYLPDLPPNASEYRSALLSSRPFKVKSRVDNVRGCRELFHQTRDPSSGSDWDIPNFTGEPMGCDTILSASESFESPVPHTERCSIVVLLVHVP